MRPGERKLVHIGYVIRISPPHFKAHPEKRDNGRSFGSVAADVGPTVTQKKIEKGGGKDDEESITGKVITDANINRSGQHERGIKSERNQKDEPLPFLVAENATNSPTDRHERKNQKWNGSFKEKSYRKIVPPTVVSIHSEQTGGMSNPGMMELPIDSHDQVGRQDPS